jgi:hypothetical protein
LPFGKVLLGTVIQTWLPTSQPAGHLTAFASNESQSRRHCGMVPERGAALHRKG